MQDFVTMRNSINEFTKMIFLYAIFSISFFETKSFGFSTTKWNVFLNFSCWFLITNDFNSNFVEKIFVYIANTDFFVNKIFVLTINLTYASKIMFRDFSLRMKSFLMFIYSSLLILKKINDFSSLMTKLTMIRYFFLISLQIVFSNIDYTWTRFTSNLFSFFVTFMIINSFNS